MPTILIVDDSRFQHSVLRQILSPAGYSLLFAADGKQALEYLSTDEVDCVLADLIMPEMRGATLLETLRDQGSRVPVVVLTADIQEHVRQECLELGARAVLHKPANPDLLLRTLYEILGEAVP